jgi:hypothetical protein
MCALSGWRAQVTTGVLGGCNTWSDILKLFELVKR